MDEKKDLLEQFRELAQSQPNAGISGAIGGGQYVPYRQPCPSCGHCPTCGRGGSYHSNPYLPYYQPVFTACKA